MCGIRSPDEWLEYMQCKGVRGSLRTRKRRVGAPRGEHLGAEAQNKMRTFGQRF